MFILVVSQIHNLHKQLRLYIFQGPSDSLYRLCKTFNFLFSVSCTSISPLRDFLNAYPSLMYSLLLATG